MQYEPVKNILSRFFSGPLFMRKAFYACLDILLLRTWHVKRALRKAGRELHGKAKILDAGAGLGQYTWRMSRMNRDWDITAVDIIEQQVNEGNDFLKRAGLSPRVRYSIADLTTFVNPSEYDLILSVDVMEHILDDEAVFRNFAASLRPGGQVIISTPSNLGGSDVEHEHDSSFIDEHVRDGYSVEDITRKLIRAGFTSVVSDYTYGVPGNISWRLSMKYPIKMLNISYLFFIVLPIWYLVVFPFSLVLNFIDLYSSHKSGTGLLVIARK